jgi:ribosomal-protein-alanine N-acetyltransferase
VNLEAKDLAITTDRLILRPLTMADASTVAQLITEKISNNTMLIPWPYGLQDAQSWIKSITPGTVLGICLKPNQLIGAVEIVLEDGGGIGFWINDGFAGHGYATEAVTAALDYNFSTHPVTTISSCPWVENTASQRIHRNLGFEEEGQEQDFWPNRQAEVPVVRFILTKERWLQRQLANRPSDSHPLPSR